MDCDTLKKTPVYSQDLSIYILKLRVLIFAVIFILDSREILTRFIFSLTCDFNNLDLRNTVNNSLIY